MRKDILSIGIEISFKTRSLRLFAISHIGRSRARLNPCTESHFPTTDIDVRAPNQGFSCGRP